MPRTGNHQALLGSAFLAPVGHINGGLKLGAIGFFIGLSI